MNTDRRATNCVLVVRCRVAHIREESAVPTAFTENLETHFLLPAKLHTEDVTIAFPEHLPGHCPSVLVSSIELKNEHSQSTVEQTKTEEPNREHNRKRHSVTCRNPTHQTLLQNEKSKYVDTRLRPGASCENFGCVVCQSLPSCSAALGFHRNPIESVQGARRWSHEPTMQYLASLDFTICSSLSGSVRSRRHDTLLKSSPSHRRSNSTANTSPASGHKSNTSNSTQSGVQLTEHVTCT